MTMRELIYNVPRTLNEATAYEFFSQCSPAIEYHESVSINFSSLSYSRPFGMLLFASYLHDFVKIRKGNGFNTRAVGLERFTDCISYLEHIGFFQYIGLNRGNMPGSTPGRISYLPITVLTREELSTDGPILGEVIQAKSEHMARIILRLPKPVYDHPVAYCLREVIRNVFEHSGSDQCTVCAQAWADNSLEIGIIDHGRGIRSSLEERYTFQNNFESLAFAIRPGTSRVDTTEQNEDVWANSGFGLYVLSELGKVTGEFLLISGESGLQIKEGTLRSVPFKYAGTAIKLQYKRPHGKNVGELVDRIIAQGEKHASSATTQVRASKSTRRISKNICDDTLY